MAINTTHDPWAGIPSRPQPDRDRYGRYLIPLRATGEIVSHTRATTWASALADRYALNRWDGRMQAIGFAQRPDLLARVAATHPDERTVLDELCEAAREHAGASTGANLGTAVHAFTEAVDLGHHPVIPDPYKADVDAYTEAMRSAGFRIVAVEQVVVVESLSEPVAGTFDRLVELDGRLYIADLKTGKTLDYSWPEITIQLALYAHGDSIWDPVTKHHLPMPDVDRERALVMHTPVGQARCVLYWADIAAGWETAPTCGIGRGWNKRKDLAQQLPSGFGGGAVVPTQPPPPVPPTTLHAVVDGIDLLAEQRRAWLRGRILALPGDGATLLAATWPEGIGRLSEADPKHFDTIVSTLNVVEKTVGAPFPEPDPNDIGLVHPWRTALSARIFRLPADLREVCDPVADTIDNGKPIPVPEWRLLEAAVDQVEDDALERRIALTEFADAVAATPVILDALGIGSLAEATSWQCSSLWDVAAALDDGLLVERGGRLVVERPLTVLDGYRQRAHLLDIAKDLAIARHRNVPKSSTQALEDPVLVAALAAALDNTTPTKENHP